MSDPSDFRPSPRRELALQGPRPTPLKLNKDSHKIKKPPIAPQPHRPPGPHPPHQQPLIIYSVSPKILHTKPTDFMTLVQRLTGPHATPDTSVADLTIPSPAARIATFESSTCPPVVHRAVGLDVVRIDLDNEPELELDVAGGLVVNRTGSMHGILSPMPSSLPPISPGFFSFLQELSPAVGVNNLINSGGNNYGGNILISPGNNNNFTLTPVLPSPRSWGDFFNQFPDL